MRIVVTGGAGSGPDRRWKSAIYQAPVIPLGFQTIPSRELARLEADAPLAPDPPGPSISASCLRLRANFERGAAVTTGLPVLIAATTAW